MAGRGAGNAGARRVYTSLDEVVAPAGVDLDEHFTAQVYGKRSGVRVPILKHFWRAAGNEPIIVSGLSTVGQGPRHVHRPSAVAAQHSGTTGARAIDNLVTTACTVTHWEAAAEMPIELNAADVGWKAGPVNGSAGRSMPVFTGAATGPREQQLSSRSSARQIMRSVQFNRRFKDTVVACTRRHCQHWTSTHSNADGTERAFRPASFKPEHVELFFAISVRVAKLNPAIPAERLWDKQHHCYDAAVDAAASHMQWRWLNRHISFGQYRRADAVSDDDSASESDDGSSSDDEGCEYGYRSRRAASDIARGQAAKAWRAGQHCGFDDFVRETRHADGSRIRHKAAVHTGRPADALNDAHSGYFLWWEEQGWVRNDTAGASRSTGAAAGEAGGSGGSGGSGGNAAAAAAANILRAAQPGGSSRAGGDGIGRSGQTRDGGGGGGGASSRSNGRPPDASDGPQDADSEEGDPDDPGDESPEDSMGQGVNSIKSRLQRACAVLQPNVGHCIWLDRGMSNLSAMESTKAAGFDVSGIMQANRIGLPRRLIASLKKRMTCSKACKHELDSSTCKRWCWTVLHKGDWELELWSDGAELVIGLSSCTSATRLVQLGRSVGRQTRLALCPLGIGMYNIFGRGPTDGGDQHRRRLSLAIRRRPRQGTKGALFDAEIGFVDGTIVAERLRSTSVTLWDFADEFSSAILSSVKMRNQSRLPAALVAAQHSSTRAQCDAHRLLNFSEEHSTQVRANAGVGKQAKRGHQCCMHGSCDPHEPKRPRYYCAGCKREREACNGWYHWSCYWKRHRADCVLPGTD